MKALIIFLWTIIGLSSCVYPTRHMMDWSHTFYGFGGFAMWIIVIALVAIIIYLAIQKEKAIKSEEKETPLDILKKRYAKGEITKKEFDSMKKDLEE